MAQNENIKKIKNTILSIVKEDNNLDQNANREDVEKYISANLENLTRRAMLILGC